MFDIIRNHQTDLLNYKAIIIMHLAQSVAYKEKQCLLP